VGGWVPRFTYSSHDGVRGWLGRLTTPTQSDEWLLVNLNKGVAHGYPLVEEQLVPFFFVFFFLGFFFFLSLFFFNEILSREALLYFHNLILFVIVMEAFSKMIAAAIDHGRISGFSVGASLYERVNISHLLFADDTLVFCGATIDQIRSIKALLVCFKLCLV
jgi:hypothetical protein